MATTILVTGSLGYIGSVLTGYLQDHEFTCVGYDTGFYRGCTLYPPREGSTVLRDMRDFREEDLDGVDAVVHLAGMSNDPVGSVPPAHMYDPTRAYSARLAALCKARGIQLIFASSCSVYGIAHEQFVTETSATAPQTPYSLNKLQIEQDLQTMSDGTFTPIILRFATVFGLSPRMRFDIVINMFVGMALTTGRIVLNSNGQAWRPHIHIEDVCRIIRWCIESPPHASDAMILNMGDTQQNFRVLDVAEMVRAKVPGCEVVLLNRQPPQMPREDLSLIRDSKIHDGVDTRTYKVSFELMKQALPGFRCRWTVEQGIETILQQLRELGLTEAQFRDPKFYRLQTLDALVRRGILTDEFTWTRSPAPCPAPAREGS